MENNNPYENLDISDAEIQEIIKIYESFPEKQKNIFGFFLLHDLTPDIIAEFYECSTTYASIKLMQAIRAYEQKHIDPDHIKLVLEIYVTTIQTKSTLKPILFRGNFIIGLTRKAVKKLQRFNPIEQVVIVICIVVFCYSGVITSQAIYKFGLVQMQHEKSADIYVSQSNENQLEVIETLYLPEYLPKGYKLVESIGKPHENEIIQTIYEFDDTEIFFQQYTHNVVIDLDNENVTSKKISVNGNDGLYNMYPEKNILMWMSSDYYYLLKTDNLNIGEKELLKISISLKEIKYEKN